MFRSAKRRQKRSLTISPPELLELRVLPSRLPLVLDLSPKQLRDDGGFASAGGLGTTRIADDASTGDDAAMHLHPRSLR